MPEPTREEIQSRISAARREAEQLEDVLRGMGAEDEERRRHLRDLYGRREQLLAELDKVRDEIGKLEVGPEVQEFAVGWTFPSGIRRAHFIVRKHSLCTRKYAVNKPFRSLEPPPPDQVNPTGTMCASCLADVIRRINNKTLSRYTWTAHTWQPPAGWTPMPGEEDDLPPRERGEGRRGDMPMPWRREEEVDEEEEEEEEE
jgi:hypothetical protein